MNFQNLQISGKGTTRKSTIGSTRESNFGVRYANYTKVTKTGPVQVSQFVFSKSGMEKTKLNLKENAAMIVNDPSTGFVGIAVTANNSKAELFKATKRSAEGEKAKSVSAPNLVKHLVDAGKLSSDFQGSQFFDLEDRGEVEGIGHVWEIVPSSEIAPRPYEAEEEVEEVNATETSEPTNNVY